MHVVVTACNVFSGLQICNYSVNIRCVSYFYVPGLILRLKIFAKLLTKDLFEDEGFWKLEEDVESSCTVSLNTTAPMVVHGKPKEELPLEN